MEAEKMVHEPGTGSMVVSLLINASKAIKVENRISVPMDM
jgi:hypothetical protein